MTIKRKGGYAKLEKLKTGGWYLDMLWVDRDCRGKGVATRLLRYIVTHCEGTIYLLATGELGSDPESLRRLYERHGFRRCKDGNDIPYNYNMRRC